MQKYMSHPKHGGMMVFMDDFEQKQKEGWVFSEVKPDASRETIVKPINKTIEQQYEAKFGKPPHHRMKPESIEAALME